MSDQSAPGSAVAAVLHQESLQEGIQEGIQDTVTASALALARILQIVHERGLLPGKQLPSEADLAQECMVSRGTIREATKALAQLGILNIRNGRRAEVAEINGRNIAILIDHAVQTAQVTVLQTWDLRQTLETRIARLAALRRSPIHVDKMRFHVAQMVDSLSDFNALTKADIELHLCFAEAAKNPLFLFNIQSMTQVMTWTGPLGYAAIGTPEKIGIHIKLHSAIVDAIERQDADEAVRLMVQHFEEAKNCMMESGLN
jgi:GntR family transcriptional regulator, transcriptional repressor for pyruvate dehydrogenase complex